jgi:hypothetical protein
MHLIRSAGTIAGALAALALAAGPASAHDCINTQKPADTGGIAGTYYIATDTFTPSDHAGNAAFVLVVFPDGSSVLSYSHSGGPSMTTSSRAPRTAMARDWTTPRSASGADQRIPPNACAAASPCGPWSP